MSDGQNTRKYIALALAAAIVLAVIVGIVGGISFLLGLFGDNGDILDEMREFAVEGEVKDLELDVDAAEISIVSGDGFCIKSNIEGLDVKNDKGVLKIKYKRIFTANASKALIEMTVPADLVFGELSVVTGAGKLSIESLKAENMSLDTGAGMAEINGLTAEKSCDIDTGAGKVTVTDADLRDLDLDIGAGKFEFSGRLSGDCDLDMGVGASDITLFGSKADYTFDVDKGIGSVNIDGTDVSDGEKIGDGDCRVDISGGIGSVTVKFKE